MIILYFLECLRNYFYFETNTRNTHRQYILQQTNIILVIVEGISSKNTVKESFNIVYSWNMISEKKRLKEPNLKVIINFLIHQQKK